MNFVGTFPARRPRRMRRDAFSRRLMRESALSSADFIYPVFVLDGSNREEAGAVAARRFAQERRPLVRATPSAASSWAFLRWRCSRSSTADRKSLDASAAWDPKGLVPQRGAGA